LQRGSANTVAFVSDVSPVHEHRIFPQAELRFIIAQRQHGGESDTSKEPEERMRHDRKSSGIELWSAPLQVSFGIGDERDALHVLVANLKHKYMVDRQRQ
jgi:hypothetical protein